MNVFIRSDLDNALVEETSVFFPLLSTFGPFKTSNEEHITDVNANSIVFVVLELFLVVKINEQDLSVLEGFLISVVLLTSFCFLIFKAIL
jgi:hypothetical protein